MNALAIVAMVVAVGAVSTAQTQAQAPAQTQSQNKKDAVIRGCLTGWKLTHIEPIQPSDAGVTLPDNLKVASLRVIRNQVKALDGHQVELIGALRGIPGLEQGILLADSPNAKVYIGGSDKNLGEDLHTGRVEPPTIYARTIKDLAESCTGAPTR